MQPSVTDVEGFFPLCIHDQRGISSLSYKSGQQLFPPREMAWPPLTGPVRISDTWVSPPLSPGIRLATVHKHVCSRRQACLLGFKNSHFVKQFFPLTLHISSHFIIIHLYRILRVLIFKAYAAFRYQRARWSPRVLVHERGFHLPGDSSRLPGGGRPPQSAQVTPSLSFHGAKAPPESLVRSASSFCVYLIIVVLL